MTPPPNTFMGHFVGNHDLLLETGKKRAKSFFALASKCIGLEFLPLAVFEICPPPEKKAITFFLVFPIFEAFVAILAMKCMKRLIEPGDSNEFRVQNHFLVMYGSRDTISHFLLDHVTF